MIGAPQRELTAPVLLCEPNGRLALDAIGWSRRPLHRCNLRGRWLAKKRWNYWAITTPTHLFSATVSSLDYAGVVFVYLADLAHGWVRETTVVTPFGRGCHLPDVPEAPVEFTSRRLSVHFVPDGTRTRIVVHVPGFHGRPLHADLVVERPATHDTLNVVVPWSRRTFQYTSKQLALPAHGTIRWGDDTINVLAPHGFACLDFGRGIWPHRCTWNWGAAAGVTKVGTIGLNVGGQWTDGTGATENAVILNGHLSKIHEPLRWDYDRRNFRRAWRVTTADRRTVDLTFTPAVERVARTNTGLVRSVVHQMLGRWNGIVRGDRGVGVPIDNLTGWAEEHVARW